MEFVLGGAQIAVGVGLGAMVGGPVGAVLGGVAGGIGAAAGIYKQYEVEGDEEEAKAAMLAKAAMGVQDKVWAGHSSKYGGVHGGYRLANPATGAARPQTGQFPYGQVPQAGMSSLPPPMTLN